MLIQRLSKKLLTLFLSNLSRTVAVSLLSLFSPIYIFQTLRAFSFSQSRAIIYIILYFSLLFSVKLASLLISENLSQKIGFKGVIWLSVIPFMFFILSLLYASSWPFLFVLSAILWGAHAGFFWWGYHGYFIKEGDKRHFGRSIGEAGLFQTTASVFTPFLGALIASLFGFSILFLLAGAFMLFTLLILGKDHDRRQRRDIKFQEVLNLIKTHPPISFAYVGSSAEAVLHSVAWPLFLFLFFGQVMSMGITVSSASLIAALFALVVGSWVDKQGERQVIRLGVPLVFASWILRLLKRSLGFFIAADSLWNFGQKMIGLPLNTLTYKKAIEGKSTGRAILFRETTSTIGSIFSLLLLLLWVSLGGSLSGAFVLAALFSLFPLIAVIGKDF